MMSVALIQICDRDHKVTDERTSSRVSSRVASPSSVQRCTGDGAAGAAGPPAHSTPGTGVTTGLSSDSVSRSDGPYLLGVHTESPLLSVFIAIRSIVFAVSALSILRGEREAKSTPWIALMYERCIVCVCVLTIVLRDALPRRISTVSPDRTSGPYLTRRATIRAARTPPWQGA